MNKLTAPEIEVALENLADWHYAYNAIEKSFTFKNHSLAFAFLTRVALHSEKINHHANYSGVYNKVTLKLQTHDAGGVTTKDIDFATAVEAF